MGILSNIFGINNNQAVTPRAKSQAFQFLVPQIAAGEDYHVALFNLVPACRQWLPMNYVEVYNQSGASISIQLRSLTQEKFYISPQSVRQIYSSFDNFIIKNEGIVLLPANACKITVQRV
jgi:hypothetical protein